MAKKPFQETNFRSLLSSGTGADVTNVRCIHFFRRILMLKIGQQLAVILD